MPVSAFLLIQQAQGSFQEFPLAAGSVVLGRADTCDIVLAGRLISRQHACIRSNGQVYTIEDLGSRNGILVNGVPAVGERVLRDGDIIELGGIGAIRFVDSDATSSHAHAPAQGVWLDEATQDVWIDGACLHPQLSSVQFALLQLLAQNLDRVCSRAEIIAAVWPSVRDGISDEAIDALIKRVRARLGEVPNGQRYLATVRGRGLILRSPRKLAELNP